MKKLSILIIFTLVLNSSYASKFESFFERSDFFLKKYVNSGSVDYSAVKLRISELNGLLSTAAALNLGDSPNSRNKAFYINVYNLIVIHDLAKRYPVSSPKAISGFHNQKKHQVNHKYYTLDGFRETILKKYPDARVCFALCDGAIGSPQLASYAFRPEKLDEQLNSRTKMAVNNSEFVRIKPASNKVIVSEVFKKNLNVFGGTPESVKAFLNQYLKEGNSIPLEYTLEFYPFDWHINK